jgi:hypothetical protein
VWGPRVSRGTEEAAPSISGVVFFILHKNKKKEMKRYHVDPYLCTDEYRKDVDENAKIIKNCFKPGKIQILKPFMMSVRKVVGLEPHWCSRTTVPPAMAQIGYKGVSKTFAIDFVNNPNYLKVVARHTTLPSDVINILLSYITLEFEMCGRCNKVHFVEFCNKNKKQRTVKHFTDLSQTYD